MPIYRRRRLTPTGTSISRLQSAPSPRAAASIFAFQGADTEERERHAFITLSQLGASQSCRHAGDIYRTPCTRYRDFSEGAFTFYFIERLCKEYTLHFLYAHDDGAWFLH